MLMTRRNTLTQALIIIAAFFVAATGVVAIDINDSEALRYSSGSDTDFRVDTDGTLHIYNNVEMAPDAVGITGGRLGIGTNTPSTLLTVDGNLALETGRAVNEITDDTSLSDNADDTLVTEQAIKSYVDSSDNTGTDDQTIVEVLSQGDTASDSQNLNIDQINARDSDGLTLTDDSTIRQQGNSINGLFVADGGQVGVGTSAPSATLDATGTPRFRGLTNCDTIDTDASGNLKCGTDASGDGGTDDQNLQATSRSGSTVTMSIEDGSSTTFTDNTVADDQGLSTTADVSGTDDRISIDNGNSVTIDDDFEADTSAATECDGTCYSDSTGSGSNPGGSTGAIQYNNGGSLAGDTSNFFYDSSNQRLGLGTSSPGRQLAVTGDAVIGDSTPTDTWADLVVESPSGQSAVVSRTEASNTKAGFHTRHPNGQGWEFSSQSFGSDVTNFKLRARDAYWYNILESTVQSSNGDIITDIHGNAESGAVRSFGDVTFFNDQAVVTPSGELGIGHTSPTATLDASGTPRFRGLTNCDTIDTDASGNLQCGTDATGSGADGYLPDDPASSNVDMNGNDINNINKIQLNNIESVSGGQIGRDNSIGYLGNWGGNGNAVLWDAYNVQDGNAITVTGGTGNEDNPNIAVSSNSIGTSELNLGSVDGRYLEDGGDTMNGNLDMGGNTVQNVGEFRLPVGTDCYNSNC
jgi:hypothetical protein